ncbi:MAG TPA: C4-type zinc ribbon domain-containing protein [Acidimicrobiales bacterium]|nr:C4-type zinc ribbon domain-containing protein [Acidimicrobiales bacterium]
MADPSLEALLEVQARDLAIDQLRYRRQALPQRQALEAVTATLAGVERSIGAATARIHELERQQRRLEDDIDLIEAKAQDSESRLYGGQVHAPKELQALATEVKSLRNRKSLREDELLEVMEEAEPLHAEIDRLQAEAQALTIESDRLAGAIADEEATIDGQKAGEMAARTDIAAKVSENLLATYEKLRHRLNGVGIARVDVGRCTGCHLSLSAVELDSLRRAAEGEVVRHEECGRILVP